MRNLLVITDFIEGQPVVASVRYSELMKYMKEKYNIIVINDKKNTEINSIYADLNFNFITTKGIYTQDLDSKTQKISRIEKMLRNRFVLFAWRNYSASEWNFKRKNKELFYKLNNYMRNNDIECIFATVPDIYVLYLVKYIKKNFNNIPVVVEARDIINHKIGKGNPKYIFSKAEKIMIENANSLIALSEGIYDYYSKLKPNLNINLIKNGYNCDLFIESMFNEIDLNKDRIIFSHIGSIYKGRNIKGFIEALIIISENLNKIIEFNIVGYLDSEALEDIDKIKSKIEKSNIVLNITGTVKHDKAIEYLKECDIAVILTHIKGSDYAIPGKTFEYIGSCKPIIAVSEDKGLISLIDGKYGECANHNIKDIVNKIMDILVKRYNFEDRKKFSRKKQADQIINFINKTIILNKEVK